MDESLSIVKSSQKKPNTLIRSVKTYYKSQIYLASQFSRGLNIENCYTELALVSQKEQEEKEKNHLKENKKNQNDVQDRRIPSYEHLHAPKEKIELPQIFDKADTHKVVVLGRAGIGKSTLCHRIAYEWAHGRLWEDQFDLVVWIPLRNIANYSDNEDTVFHIIQKECLSRDDFGEYSFEISEIQNALKENKRLRILYLLDGVDEISSLIKTNSSQAKLLQKLFLLQNLFITSRPYSLDSFLSTLGNFKVDKTLENMGFSDRQSEQFVDRFFTEVQSPSDKALALKRHIKTNPNIKGIAHIPVVLLLMCKFWQNCSGDEKSLPTNMTELYDAITVDLCRSYVEKIIKKAGNEKTLCRPILRCLGQLAFEKMQEPDLIISPQAIKKAIETTAPNLLFKDFVDFGLLTATHENASTKPATDEKDYYFVHLTFQEFFAAWHIAEGIKARNRKIYDFIRDHKYNPAYEIVWWFVAGLLKRYPDEIEMFFGILESAPKDLIDSYHQLLIIRCMDECNLATTPERRSRFLHSFRQLLTHDLMPLKEKFRSTEEAHPFSSHRKRFLRYVKLSPRVLYHQEVKELATEFLSPQKEEEEEEALETKTILPKATPETEQRLDASTDTSRCAAIRFFMRERTFSPELISIIDSIISSPYKCLSGEIGQFILSHDRLPNLTELLEQSSLELKETTIKYLTRRKNVPLELIEIIKKSMLNNDVISIAAIKFVSAHCEPSVEITETMAKILAHKFEFSVSGYESVDKEAVLDFFMEQENVSPTTIIHIALLFAYPLGNLGRCVADYFNRKKNMPSEFIKLLIYILQTCDRPDHLPIPEEIINIIIQLLIHPYPSIRKMAINYLQSIKNVPEKIIEIIEGQLENSSPYKEVGSAAIDFFRVQSTVSTKVIDTIKKYLTWPKFQFDAIKFFIQQQAVTPEILQLVKQSFQKQGISGSDSVGKFFITLELANLSRMYKAGEYTFDEANLDLIALLQEPITYDDDSLNQLQEHGFSSLTEHVIEFLSQQKSLPDELINALVPLLTHPNEKIRGGAVKCFRSSINIPLKSIIPLLHDSVSTVRCKTVFCLTGKSEVPVEMVSPLLSDPDSAVCSTTISFFEHQPTVPSNVVSRITHLLEDPSDKIGCAAIRFFLTHPTLLYLFFEKIDSSKLISKRHSSLVHEPYIGTLVSLSDMVTFANQMNKRNIGPKFLTLLTSKLSVSHTQIYVQSSTCIQVGTIGVIRFDTEAQLQKFVRDFQDNLSRFNLVPSSHQEHFFEDLDRALMRSPDIAPPTFLSEQDALCADSSQQEKLRAIAPQLREIGSPTVFISHAWQLPPEEDKKHNLHEQYVDYFVKKLAIHLRLLGFNVILDFDSLGTGVRLATAMKEAVLNADHILLVATDTYFWKLKNRVLSGVGRELGLIRDRINFVTPEKAHRDRLFHGFLLTNHPPADFTLIEGYDGFAGLWMRQTSYIHCLLELVHKISNGKIAIDHIIDAQPQPNSLAQNMRRLGIHRESSSPELQPKHFHTRTRSFSPERK